MFRRSPIRRSFQIAALLFTAAAVIFSPLDGNSFCNTMKAIISPGTRQFAVGIIFTAGTLLFGKLFCSYLCPVGFTGELLMQIRKKLNIRGFEIRNGSVPDILLRGIKYMVLFSVCYLYSRYGLFESPLSVAAIWTVILSAAVLLTAPLFINMFWCKYICPLGAFCNILRFTLVLVVLLLIYAVFSAAGIEIPWLWFMGVTVISGYLQEILLRESKYNTMFLFIYKDDERCEECGECMRNCPYGVDLHEIKTIADVNCTLCGECVNSCKEGALSLTNSKRGKYIPPAIVLVLSAAAILALILS